MWVPVVLILLIYILLQYNVLSEYTSLTCVLVHAARVDV